MFGKNKIASPHAFDDAPANSLMITTIFPTLQGEGPFSGCPATFIRLSRCNLKCSFCDTFFDAGDYMNFTDILAKAYEGWLLFRKKHQTLLYSTDKPLLVITGGEPLMQPNIEAFCRYALIAGYAIQIETNGIFFRDLPDPVHVLISPKCNEATREYIMPHLAMLNRANSLKFVVSADEPGYTTIPEFARLWLLRHSPKGGQIFVSPMNCYQTQPVSVGSGATLEQRVEHDEKISFWDPHLLDMQQNQKNHEYAALVCMKYGLRLSLQSHLFARLP